MDDIRDEINSKSSRKDHSLTRLDDSSRDLVASFLRGEIEGLRTPSLLEETVSDGDSTTANDGVSSATTDAKDVASGSLVETGATSNSQKIKVWDVADEMFEVVDEGEGLGQHDQEPQQPSSIFLEINEVADSKFDAEGAKKVLDESLAALQEIANVIPSPTKSFLEIDSDSGSNKDAFAVHTDDISDSTRDAEHVSHISALRTIEPHDEESVTVTRHTRRAR